MQRRHFLKLGLGGAAVLVLVGGGVALFHPGLREGRLTAEGREVFHAVARGVLDGSLPADAAQRNAALQAHMARLDDVLGAFPSAVQAELSQLLAILAAVPGRAALAGLHVSWPSANTAQIQSALQGMRTSSIALRQQAYHAMRDLTNAAYYADAQIWPLMGYPGPRAL
jgi:hypothetical protein